ncbi:MAG TPA: hypothetical protein VGP07_17985 [Polyangia bacterium]
MTDSSATTMSGTAFELVTLLPGFTRLGKRSGELDGNLPVRAARYCGPVFEGSAAGFQILLHHPMTVRRGRDGGRDGTIAWDLTPPALEMVTAQVDDALERGVREGLLAAGGYWHRLLRGDALPVRHDRVFVWTGHLIRPRRGLWLLVGGAMNRRSRVPVVDHLVTDADGFVPLVVELDARALGSEPAWMEAELGCVTPLVPNARMRKERLQPGAAQLREFGDYFSEAYFETKAKHPTASYMRHQRERRVKAAEAGDARLLFAGPDVHAIGEFRRHITATGFSTKPSSPGVLQFGLIRNIAPIRWTWQGQTHSAFDVDKERLLPALEKLWKATVGDAHPSAFEFLSGYVLGEQWDQPYVQLQPWVFTPTPDGWSMLVDGVHHPPEYDGMRAVIATDWFSSLAMVYRLFGPSSVRIPFRAPLLRALPVQRAALELGMTESVLAGAQTTTADET